MRSFKHIFLALAALLTVTSVMAQNERFEVYGAGRFLLKHGEVGGERYDGGIFMADTLAPDTVNPQKEMRGAALFDLGFRLRPNASTEINVLTRVTSDLDGFWGEGIGFGFRELYVRGLIRGKVRYRVGDLDLKMTPFTLFNSSNDLGDHRLSMFHLYEDIIQYEYFYRENRWRQQGIQTDFKVRLPGKGHSLKVDAFMAKNRQTDFFFTSDRLLGGASLVFAKKDWGSLGYHMVSLFDVAETAQFSDGERTNNVHTFKAESTPLFEKDMVAYAEAGWSTLRFEELENAPADSSDHFIQLGVKGRLNKAFGYNAEFMYVGAGFRSPGAQSRRLNVDALPVDFPFQGNTELQRSLSVYDALLDPSVYSRTIVPQLQSFRPAYGNLQPYGVATPNRQGLSAMVFYNNDSTTIKYAELRAAYMTENTGEGINKFRNFTQLAAFVRLHVNELWEGEHRFIVEGNLRLENTQRDALDAEIPQLAGIGAVDLGSQFAELSVSYELDNDLFLQLGMMNLNASGNEYLTQRNVFGVITDYQLTTIEVNDQTLTAGLKYSFNPNTHLSLQGRRSTISDGSMNGTSYRIDQFVALFNIFF